MIPAIDTILSRWGKWVIKSDSKGLGYPSTCPMFRDFRSGEVHRSSPPLGIFTGRDTLDDVNKIVASLGRIDQVRCYEYYVVGGKKEAIAVRMGIAVREVYRWRDKLHEAVQNRMCDGGKGDK